VEPVASASREVLIGAGVTIGLVGFAMNILFAMRAVSPPVGQSSDAEGRSTPARKSSTGRPTTHAGPARRLPASNGTSRLPAKGAWGVARRPSLEHLWKSMVEAERERDPSRP
jgi:hypothetical protein